MKELTKTKKKMIMHLKDDPEGLGKLADMLDAIAEKHHKDRLGIIERLRTCL